MSYILTNISDIRGNCRDMKSVGKVADSQTNTKFMRWESIKLSNFYVATKMVNLLLFAELSHCAIVYSKSNQGFIH